MTPNTLNYMIAGYIVIIVGIVGYLISIVVRLARSSRKLTKQPKPTDLSH